MARLIIHPGEHLADELQALGMSANELAKSIGGADEPDHRDHPRQARHLGGYGLAPRAVVRHRAGYLDEPAKKLRTAAGGAGNRRGPGKNPSASRGRQDEQ